MDLLLGRTHRVETRHFWFRGLRRFLRPLLVRAAAGRRGLRLLDCGCGTGANLPLLGSFGSVHAIDLSDYGLRLAQSAGFALTARASAASLPFPDGAFDIATSIDVLYCLEEEDERRAVSEMHRVLTPGGRAIFNVAAMDILHGNHSVLSEEIRRYNRPRLRSLLAGAGFEIEHLAYTNSLLFPLVLAQRTVERVAGLATPGKAAEKMRVPPAAINEPLAAVLAVEGMVRRLLPLPFGSSLLCLARKPPTPLLR